jgi:(p)ppGpp synthase/HD superfamily hydrolase
MNTETPSNNQITDLETKAKLFAIKKHSAVNHFYDNKPYSVHLESVVYYAKKYIDRIVPQSFHQEVIASCWLHDTIEDCRLTYNDIQKEFGTLVAEMVYACSNEKGKNRKERANDKYYRGIRNTSYATFVKMCDRLANIAYSEAYKTRMLAVYRAEQKEFIDILINKQSSLVRFQYLDMINLMKTLLETEEN